MGKAIGASLPLAAGIAVSPIPIIAMVLMLTSTKARTNGPAFIAGWLLGLGIIGAIVLTVAGQTGAGSTGEGPAPTWESWLKIALGVLLLWDAVAEFQARPRGEEQPKMPKWMATVDKTTPVVAIGLGALLSGLNPKNLLLAIAGATSIAQTGISGVQQAFAYVVFVLIGTLGIATPAVIYFTMKKRSEKLLADLRTWMARNNAVILSVLCLIIAAKLIGDGISALAG
jgi:threonine/homoserine/homoserine lactone efflux protein